MLHPKKHAPDFVCKKRYTTEFELQKGTRCTPFHTKKMRLITETTWLSTCMNFAWHLVCLCKIQASYVEAHSQWFFDFSRIQRFDGQWVMYREFSHEFFNRILLPYLIPDYARIGQAISQGRLVISSLTEKRGWGLIFCVLIIYIFK